MSWLTIPRNGHNIRVGYDPRNRNYFAQARNLDGNVLLAVGLDPECLEPEDLSEALAEKLTANAMPLLTDDEQSRFTDLLANAPYLDIAPAVTEVCDRIKAADANGDNLGIQDGLTGPHNISDLIEFLAGEDRLNGLAQDDNGEVTGLEDSFYDETALCTTCGRYRVEHRNRILWPAACETYTATTSDGPAPDKNPWQILHERDDAAYADPNDPGAQQTSADMTAAEYAGMNQAHRCGKCGTATAFFRATVGAVQCTECFAVRRVRTGDDGKSKETWV